MQLLVFYYKVRRHGARNFYTRSTKITDEYTTTFNTCAATLPSSNCCTRSLRFSCCTMPPAFPTMNDNYLKAAPKRGRAKAKNEAKEIGQFNSP